MAMPRRAGFSQITWAESCWDITHIRLIRCVYIASKRKGADSQQVLQLSWVNTWCWGAWLHGCQKNSGAFNLSDPVRTSSDSETSKEIFYASQSKAPALSRPSPRRAAHICATCPRVALGHPQGGLRLPLAHNAWHSEQAPRSCRPRSCKAPDTRKAFQNISRKARSGPSFLTVSGLQTSSLGPRKQVQNLRPVLKRTPLVDGLFQCPTRSK